MILSVGADIVDLDRLGKTLERVRERFMDRILTREERAYCESRKHPLPSIGARFAAKEAVMKCLGTGWTGGVTFKDIEVRRSEKGAPFIHLSGVARERAEALGIRRIHLSLSHTNRQALAFALAEG